MSTENMPDISFFVGIDWATETHEICVLDATGAEVKRRSVEHSGVAVHKFIEWLSDKAQTAPERVAVAIEVPRGALVEGMLERGFRVFSINPKQVDRFRDRFFPSGAKDDSKDAFVLAHCLMTDPACYREAQVDDPVVMQIREHVRMHEELKRERNRLTNQFRNQLLRYFPELLSLCSSVDEPWFLDLVELAPVPDRARRLQLRTVVKLLRKHRIRRLDPEEVVKVLRARPLRLAHGSVEAASAHVELLIPRIRLACQQAALVRKRLDTLLSVVADPEVDEAEAEVDEAEEREHRDVDIILSLPGAGTIITATMLGEAEGAIRDRDYNALRAHGGLAPVTRQTGKQRHGKSSRRKPHVMMRRAANGRLRNAFYNMARVASIFDPPSKAYYQRLRGAGHSHGRALRTVGDRLLRILIAMLRSDTLYDLSRFERTDQKENQAA